MFWISNDFVVCEIMIIFICVFWSVHVLLILNVSYPNFKLFSFDHTSRYSRHSNKIELSDFDTSDSIAYHRM